VSGGKGHGNARDFAERFLLEKVLTGGLGGETAVRLLSFAARTSKASLSFSNPMTIR
jgi:hypothetical protein